MGGSDDPSNLVLVSIEEHAELHLALYLEHGKYEDYIAYHMLAGKTDEGEAAMNTWRSEYMANREITDETRERMSKGQKRRFKNGVPEELSKKWSAARMGEKNPFYGKTHSDDTKKKLSAAARKQWETPVVWINNGVINRRVPESEIPQGFVRGKVKRSIAK